MRTSSSAAAESVSPLGIERMFRLGVWCTIAVGVSHLIVTALTALGSPDPGTERALDAMRGVSTTLPGIHSDMAQLYYGFGVAMALLAIGFGLLDLVVLRLAPGTLGRSTALLWVNIAVSAPLLVVAVLAFPLPPILATAGSLAAYVWALAMTRRRLARSPSAGFEGRST